MKNKGFTLVELLAVIVLLSLLVMIAVPAITGILKESKEDLYNTQLKQIEAAAKNWASDEEGMARLPKTDGSCGHINIRDLKDGEYIDANLKNPQDEEAFGDDEVRVNITKKGKRLEFKAVDASNVSEYNKCSHI